MNRSPAPEHRSAGDPEHRLAGLHHVLLAMPAGREDEADRFYRDVLGLRAVQKPEQLAGRGGRWFEMPGAQVHLGVEEGFAPARKAHPAFLVDGLDALERRLRSAGCEVVLDVQLEGHRRFYTFDPFGNRLELIERS
jgi:catechol 2,3-dioxygenase-like lactoylglutathione lyase family enzyme